MKINSKAELQNYLLKNCKEAGSYALVTYGGETISIWITRYPNWTKENDTWFLEAPNDLNRWKIDEPLEESLMEYMKEIYEDTNADLLAYLKSMVKDGYLYEIDSPQTGPFLPEQLDDIRLISEGECLDWIIEHYNINK